MQVSPVFRERLRRHSIASQPHSIFADIDDRFKYAANFTRDGIGREPTEKPIFIYAVQVRPDDPLWIKFGRSTNARGRIKAYRSVHAGAEPLATWPGDIGAELFVLALAFIAGGEPVAQEAFEFESTATIRAVIGEAQRFAELSDLQRLRIVQGRDPVQLPSFKRTF